MAQTRRRRRTKHRGTPAGTIEARGRTGRKPRPEERRGPRPARKNRFDQPPTWPGFGPFESYDADETVEGGERLELAGFDIDVLFVPGHSPGHVAYSLADEQALFSGDVLFQGSVGRTDLPFGDWPTLSGSIATLLDTLPAETRVHPGHMGLT